MKREVREAVAPTTKTLITRLEPGTLAALMNNLITADARQLGVAPADIVASDAITAPDKGLDAKVRNVKIGTGNGLLLFDGLNGFQYKTTAGSNPSVLRLPVELAKPGPSELLALGGTYVLCWNKDMNPALRADVEAAVDKAAREVLQDRGVAHEPRTKVLDAGAIAAIAEAYPAAAADLGLNDFEVALSLEEVQRNLHSAERSFETDEARAKVIELIRERIADATAKDPVLLTLTGDPGVGKTRVVVEALEPVGTAVLFVSGSDDLRLLATRLTRRHESTGILVADDIDDADVTDAARPLSGTSGRWKVIAIRSRTSSRWVPSAGRFQTLAKLETDAMERLIVRYSGLPERLATMVARVADGFPELAFRLTQELEVDPNLDLVRLARLGPDAVLQRALPDADTRRHLAPIALFSRVGADGDVAYQLEAIAKAFNLNPSDVLRYCDREMEQGRFVSRAGRYRLISPLLVAIWLATDLMETTDVVERVSSLPEVLQTAFANQLEYFGPSAPYLPATIARVLEAPRFRRIPDFTEAAARFLRAAAAIAPEQAAAAITELVSTANNDELRGLPRRDLVWALEILLGTRDTWVRAIESLLRLAIEETETWANNATSEFADSFAIFLSGSTVPYVQRAAWLRSRIKLGTPNEQDLLAKAALAGLRSSNSRASVGFRGGGEPADWAPATGEEWSTALRTAFSLVLAVIDRSSETVRTTTATELSHDLRWLIERGLLHDVREGLAQRRWSEAERALLASGIRRALQFGEYDERTRADVQALHDHLMGKELSDELRVILLTPLWELESDVNHDYGAPPLLVDAATRLASQQNAIEILLREGREVPDQATRYALARILARSLGVKRVGDAGYKESDWVTVRAALSVADELGESAWATTTLEHTRHAHPSELTGLLDYVNLDDRRLELVVTSAEAGESPAGPLANLILGARAKQVKPEMLTRVLRLLRQSGLPGPALGALEQWTKAHAEMPEDLQVVAGELALDAVRAPKQTMTEHYLEELVARKTIGGDLLVSLLDARLHERSGLPDNLDRELLKAALEQRPHAVLELALRIVEEGPKTSALYGSSDLGMLSRTASALTPDEVWQRVGELTEKQLRWALHHMNWAGYEPEPLVRLFLMSGRLNGLESEASVCFSNTLGVVVGHMHDAIAREVERAQSWARSLVGTSAEGWATRLVESKESEHSWMAEREAEEDARLGI